MQLHLFSCLEQDLNRRFAEPLILSRWQSYPHYTLVILYFPYLLSPFTSYCIWKSSYVSHVCFIAALRNFRLISGTTVKTTSLYIWRGCRTIPTPPKKTTVIYSDTFSKSDSQKIHQETENKHALPKIMTLELRTRLLKCLGNKETEIPYQPAFLHITITRSLP
jgi:hypothetical protein